MEKPLSKYSCYQAVSTYLHHGNVVQCSAMYLDHFGVISHSGKGKEKQHFMSYLILHSRVLCKLHVILHNTVFPHHWYLLAQTVILIIVGYSNLSAGAIIDR